MLTASPAAGFSGGNNMKWLLRVPIWAVGIPLVLIMGVMEVVLTLLRLLLDTLDRLYHWADEW